MCVHMHVCVFKHRVSYLVDVTHLPEEHKKLLVELYTFTGARQVCLCQRIVQQSCDALQEEGEVLKNDNRPKTEHRFNTTGNRRQKWKETFIFQYTAWQLQ